MKFALPREHRHLVVIRSVFIPVALALSDVSLWADAGSPNTSPAAYLNPFNTDTEDLSGSPLAI
ncbi:MAG: hypothetical protein ACR2RV_13875 [Verrucomicrobiales bacterium]